MLGFCHGKPPANSKLKYDGWKNNHLPSEMMTWRGLKDALNGKGSVDVFVGQMEFKDLLFNKLVPKLISNTWTIICGERNGVEDLFWNCFPEIKTMLFQMEAVQLEESQLFNVTVPMRYFVWTTFFIPQPFISAPRTYNWDEKITTLMRDTVNLHTTYRESCPYYWMGAINEKYGVIFCYCYGRDCSIIEEMWLVLQQRCRSHMAGRHGSNVQWTY